MKRFLMLACAAMIGASMWAEKKTVTFTVEPPLVCQNCENKVKENIRFEKGIKAVKPSAAKGVVEVTYDDKKTDVDAIRQGFGKIGYEATLCAPLECTPEVCPETECAPETCAPVECAPAEVPCQAAPGCCGAN